MKITRVETFLVPPGWPVCRVETDDGVVGSGEPVVEGRAEGVRTAVGVLAEYLLGQDPVRIQDHRQVPAKGGFYRGGPVLSSAPTGLDRALRDIAGRAYGAPVHALLAVAVRDSVRVYAWVRGDEPAELREQVAEQTGAGFDAVKTNAAGRTSPMPTPAETASAVERVAAVRDVPGAHRDVAVDFHGRFSPAGARRVPAGLGPPHPLFAEEPLLPEPGRLLDRLVAAGPVPIATGERLSSRGGFLPALTAGIAVARPDLSRVRAADRRGHAWRSPVWRRSDGSFAEW